MIDLNTKLFFCYAWEDLNEVNSIVADIQHELGSEVNVLQYDESVDVEGTLCPYIDQADLILVFVSETSKSSKVVRQCISYCNNLNKRILPLEVNKSNLFSSLPQEFKFRTKLIDYKDEEQRAKFFSLLKATCGITVESGDNYGTLIHLTVDSDVSVWRYGKKLCDAKINSDNTIRLTKGTHKIDFKTEGSDEIVYSVPVEIRSNEGETFEVVKIAKLIKEKRANEALVNGIREKYEQERLRKEQERLQKEEERKERLEKLKEATAASSSNKVTSSNPECKHSDSHTARKQEQESNSNNRIIKLVLSLVGVTICLIGAKCSQDSSSTSIPSEYTKSTGKASNAKNNDAVIKYFEDAIGENDNITREDLNYLTSKYKGSFPYDEIDYSVYDGEDPDIQIIPKSDVIVSFVQNHYNVSLPIAKSFAEHCDFKNHEADYPNFERAYTLYKNLNEIRDRNRLNNIREILHTSYFNYENRNENLTTFEKIFDASLSCCISQDTGFDDLPYKDIIFSLDYIDDAVNSGFVEGVTSSNASLIREMYYNLWIYGNPEIDSDGTHYLDKETFFEIIDLALRDHEELYNEVKSRIINFE